MTLFPVGSSRKARQDYYGKITFSGSSVCVMQWTGVIRDGTFI
ncbi:hypothetical protein VL20_55 [Microcystis panniformis FACHB-1757]|uniref:Uncharacterized protein n=1 Tax=Microcystis panniformis FACHB-1757 TaxID=1638788 RepID=A0A0K1RTS6_9CHRO|nr:hypothetical protein VL20_55 [Microcystis panniformis FACHB-1757]